MTQEALTLVPALQGLRSDPLSPSSPFLQVFEDELSEAQERTLPLTPYCVVLGLPEEVFARYLGGAERRTTQFDIILEQRPQENGDRAPRASITALRDQIERILPRVNYLRPGMPLIGPPRYEGGSPVAVVPDGTKRLSTTLRYRVAYRVRV